VEKKIRHSSSNSCNLSNEIHFGNQITDDNAGEIICNNCGAVLEEKTLSYETHKKEVIGF